MKRLIITRADDNIKAMTDITLPIMREYAKKCDADFKIISGDAPFLSGDNLPHYRILEVADLLDEYDRVLCLDADMIINKDCPNIFEVVPEDKIGTIFEDVGSRKSFCNDIYEIVDGKLKRKELEKHLVLKAKPSIFPRSIPQGTKKRLSMKFLILIQALIACCLFTDRI